MRIKGQTISRLLKGLRIAAGIRSRFATKCEQEYKNRLEKKRKKKGLIYEAFALKGRRPRGRVELDCVKMCERKAAAPGVESTVDAPQKLRSRRISGFHGDSAFALRRAASAAAARCLNELFTRLLQMLVCCYF